MRNLLSAIGLVLAVGLVASWLAAADRATPTLDATAAAERSIEPGIAVTFEHDESGRIDHRVDRLLALYVPAAQSPSALLPPGRFTATWRGDLNVPLRDRYNFRFTGRGEFTLIINGEVALEASATDEPISVTSPGIWLRQGANAVEVTYGAPAEGDAQVRFEWSSPDFIFEPPNPTVWTHNASEAGLQRAERVRLGRELLAEHRCLRCHAPPAGLLGEAAMPELAMDAPMIMDVGLRLREPWLADWLRDPHALRPDATMPKLFHGEDADRDARDAAAYLATLEFGALRDAGPVPTEAPIVDHGGRLFASLGCVGCHTLNEPATGDRLSLSHVAAKFHGPALRGYLLDPAARYAHTAMPDFDLDSEQATALAAFLIDATDDDDEPDHSAGDPNRGQRLIAQAGCTNCHALPVASEMNAPALVALSNATLHRGCLADDPADRGSAPILALSAVERQAIRRLADHGWEALSRDNPAEYAQRQLHRLNCNACHQLDGRLDRWTFHAAEVAALLPPREQEGELEIDQSRPPLTWAGEKLQPAYIRDLLARDLGHDARPWLDAKMPAFPAAARDGFARGLSMLHGLPPNPDPPSIDADLAETGRRLVSARFGFGCTDCHAVGSFPAQNVFTDYGNNLALAAERLRPEFYYRWMNDPPRYVPHTKMPRYADDHGYTALADTLDGEARAQFEAIWHYLMSQPDGNPAEE